MLEMLINPKKAERKPWEMFFIGFFYAALSVLLVDWIFLKDAVLSEYTSILILTFTVMFSIPFIYYIFRFEESKDIKIKKEVILLKEHGKALLALLWLFLGFVVAFSLLFILLPQDLRAKNFHAQIEQYCAINMPYQMKECAGRYGISADVTETKTTGKVYSSMDHFIDILTNNLFVLIFVLIFSLAFGAGAIFILAWNAGVIASAIGTYTEAKILNLHIGLMRYMIHGIPEIAAYFIAALAGGIISIAVIRHDFEKKEFWRVLLDSVDLILLSIGVLIFAGLIEVFITPLLF